MPRSLNILVVSSKYPPEYSGSGNRAHSMYQRLTEKYGVHFDVLCGSEIFDDRVKYTHDGVNIYRVASGLSPRPTKNGRRSLASMTIPRLKYLMESVPTYLHLLRHREYDAIHTFGNIAVTSSAISFAKMFKTPLIVELTSDRSSPHSSEPRIVRRLWGERLPENSRIVCISERLRRMCNSYGYNETVWSRPNPIDESRFSPEPDRKLEYRRTHTKFGPDDVVLSYIGKFIPSKNQKFLIDVLRELPGRYKLYIGGPVVDSGPLLERDRAYLSLIREAIESAGLEDRVQLVPEFVEHPEAIMKASDAYLFPSLSEGLGTPLLEALVCGVPVVANDIPGITDQWIEVGETGFISSMDSGVFANHIKKAADLNRSRLIQEAHQVLSQASTAVIDEQYWNLINDVVGQKAAERSESLI